MKAPAPPPQTEEIAREQTGPLAADRVTIVILNWNRAAETAACLESLAQAELGGAAIVVVDNGSRDDSVARLRERYPGVRVVALPENRGFAGGANAGITAALEAGAEGVLLLNNDTQVAPDFLRPLIDAMNASPWSAGVASAIFRLDRPDMLDVAYAEVCFEDRHAVHILGVNALPGEGFDHRREVQVAVGCCLLLKAAALRRVGLFDEAFFAYHEDVDWCLRARRIGYQLFYEPYSRVYHQGSGSTTPLRARPAPAASGGSEDTLPNAEPLPWNPIRTYLGIRNTVRLLARYANKKQRIAFARACLRELPLEFTALLMDEAGRMKLGHWSYARFRQAYFVERHPWLARPARGRAGACARAAAFAVTVPVDVCWCLPRDVWRAWRRGRFGEFVEYLRGLRDGVLGRRLPLRRLRLR